MAYTKEHVNALVMHLKRMGHSDAKPFIDNVLVSAPVPEHIPIRAVVQVQTKAPAQKLADYHIWIRPLSGHVMLMTEDGPMDIDVVYGILNGSEGIPSAAVIDDTNTWE